MEIKRVVFNPFRENTYLVWDDTLEAIVVDAGNMNEGENRILEEMIASRGLKPVMAVNTHGHFDHIGGVEERCVDALLVGRRRIGLSFVHCDDLGEKEGVAHRASRDHHAVALCLFSHTAHVLGT